MTSPHPGTIAKNASSSARHDLIIASNRLPTRLAVTGDRLESHPSSGGLASALTGLQTAGGFAWVGWPGCPVPDDLRDVAVDVMAGQGLVPVFLTAQDEQLYYRGICNEVLWPLFHYSSARIAFTYESWQHYVAVNERFAERILEICHDDSTVWVHDFHLMLVPSLLRAARPDLRIGFFLHIPFPSSEIYRLLPSREATLRGVLGAAYIGFHTNEYARHFRSACLRVLGLESDPGEITYEGRLVGIGTNPIGIDVAGFRDTLQSPETAANVADLEERYRGRQVILGVERLDYTKGVPNKLQAFERVLERNPERARDVTFLQLLVPSRLNHPEYQSLKRDIEQTIGRLNGRFGGPGRTPIEYMHRSVDSSQLAALYRVADVGLVTPLRDGMNLVAQEFVLCQGNNGPGQPYQGILVLSEFAGAAHYLSRSILVNPRDIEQTADAIEKALAMSASEKQERMRTMVHQVEAMHCQGWAEHFLAKLAETANRSREQACRKRIGDEELDAIHQEFCEAGHRIFALDYDGTLREIARSPDEASPTPEIRAILRALAALPDTEVHLISGRSRETMESWFGDLPIHLCAEHGYTACAPGGTWQSLHQVDTSWMAGVEETLLQASREVPGTLVERKNCAIAWHYRMADLDYGQWRARELMLNLEENLANQPVEVITGHRVIEVRAGGINKGTYLRNVVAEASPPAPFVLCAGDDRTDTDMYRVLTERDVTIHVGLGAADCRFSLESPARLRAVLTALGESGLTPHLQRSGEAHRG